MQITLDLYGHLFPGHEDRRQVANLECPRDDLNDTTRTLVFLIGSSRCRSHKATRRGPCVRPVTYFTISRTATLLGCTYAIFSLETVALPSHFWYVPAFAESLTKVSGSGGPE